MRGEWRSRVMTGSIALTAALAVASLRGVALAAQTDISIAMPTAAAEPQILGPATFAAKSGTAFLYTIAATGQKPLMFTATGLPAGLTSPRRPHAGG
jgi:alpha-galactosidase